MQHIQIQTVHGRLVPTLYSTVLYNVQYLASSHSEIHCCSSTLREYLVNRFVVLSDLINHVIMESCQKLIYISLHWFIEGFKQCLLGAAQTLTMNPSNYQSKDTKRELSNRKNPRYTNTIK